MVDADAEEWEGSRARRVRPPFFLFSLDYSRLILPSSRSYVDTQLQKSKRFDAAGMQRDHPELFRPVSSRRYSRTASSASLATDGAPIKRSGVSTPGHHHGSMTPLSMTGLNEALLKRNNSISSSAGGRKGDEGDEGQLRYWTNDMCRKSPHLFDFVITVRLPSLLLPLHH